MNDVNTLVKIAELTFDKKDPNTYCYVDVTTLEQFNLLSIIPGKKDASYREENDWTQDVEHLTYFILLVAAAEGEL